MCVRAPVFRIFAEVSLTHVGSEIDATSELETAARARLPTPAPPTRPRGTRFPPEGGVPAPPRLGWAPPRLLLGESRHRRLSRPAGW